MSGPDQAPIRCRRESPPDWPAIRRVLTAAFGQTAEADLVERLRAAGALALSAVAEVNGEIRGYIGFSPVTIASTGRHTAALALAPLGVLPAWQRDGIGSALVRWGFDECRRVGHSMVIVVGHADYYPRFGFVPAGPQGIRCPFPVPDEAFMVAELKPGSLRSVLGTVRYRPEFSGL